MRNESKNTFFSECDSGDLGTFSVSGSTCQIIMVPRPGVNVYLPTRENDHVSGTTCCRDSNSKFHCTPWNTEIQSIITSFCPRVHQPNSCNFRLPRSQNYLGDWWTLALHLSHKKIVEEKMREQQTLQRGSSWRRVQRPERNKRVPKALEKIKISDSALNKEFRVERRSVSHMYLWAVT